MTPSRTGPRVTEQFDYRDGSGRRAFPVDCFGGKRVGYSFENMLFRPAVPHYLMNCGKLRVTRPV